MKVPIRVVLPLFPLVMPRSVVRVFVQLMNSVLRLVAASLTAVEAALKGLGPMTEECAQVITSLSQARVPRSWTLGEVVLPNLGQWMTMVQLQEGQLRRWATVAQPAVFWLPGFFNPKVFFGFRVLCV
jgi:dynein heavy chain, axonemal